MLQKVISTNLCCPVTSTAQVPVGFSASSKYNARMPAFFAADLSSSPKESLPMQPIKVTDDGGSIY
jgi:hypothetical protein